MKSNLFISLFAMILLFACTDENEEIVTNSSARQGGWGDGPIGIMTLDQLLATPGNFKFLGPEDKIYLFENGSLSNNQQVFDAAVPIEVIFPDTTDVILVMSHSGNEMLICPDNSIHGLSHPCNIQLNNATTIETYKRPCFDGIDYVGFVWCDVTTTWNCLNWTIISRVETCQNCP